MALSHRHILIAVVVVIYSLWIFHVPKDIEKVVPKLYSRPTTIHVRLPDGVEDTDNLEKRMLSQVAEQWMDFCWIKGAYLPWPFPPIQIDNAGLRYIPPGLLERIISKNETEIRYKVDNPGMMFTLLHTHRGRVSFDYHGYNCSIVTARDHEVSVCDATIVMKWQVEMRPRIMSNFIMQQLTTAIVSFYSRSFQLHMQEEPVFKLWKPSTWDTHKIQEDVEWRDGYLEE